MSDTPTGVNLIPTHQDKLLSVLERIARSQEGMLAIAHEARQERIKLSNKMQEALKRPFTGGVDNVGTPEKS